MCGEIAYRLFALKKNEGALTELIRPRVVFRRAGDNEVVIRAASARILCLPDNYVGIIFDNITNWPQRERE